MLVHLTHQNLSVRALFCHNSLAKVNTQLLIYTYGYRIFFFFQFHSVSAILDTVRGAQSQTTSFETQGCPPDAPMIPRLTTKTKSSLMLKWNAPNCNGAKIHTYILQCDKVSWKLEEILLKFAVDSYESCSIWNLYVHQCVKWKKI